MANFCVKQIALELGFDDISLISQWFLSQEAITPTEWKRKFILS